MFIRSVVAPYFATNAWIIAPAANSECFIVDPGIAQPNLLAQIRQVIDENNLKPIATLITHGHLDHTFSVVPLCAGYGIPAYIHPADRVLLEDPWQALAENGESQKLMQGLGVTHFVEPEEVRELSDFATINLAGVDVTAIHAPGHTRGSTMFELTSDDYLLSGDVLFAGSIGRTDLPTGSSRQMIQTLKERVLTLNDELIVLPGHGPQTTIGRERVVNPFLTSDFLDGGS